METIEEYSNNKELWGKVFILKSKQFGTHTFLVSKFPSKSWYDKNLFIDLENEWANTLHYSSVNNDEILKVFANLKDWINREVL